MTHETKAGLLVTCSFLALVGIVLFSKMKDSESGTHLESAEQPPDPAELVSKQPSENPPNNINSPKKPDPVSTAQVTEKDRSPLSPSELPKLQPAPKTPVQLVSNNEPQKPEPKNAAPRPEAKKETEKKPDALTKEPDKKTDTAAKETRPSWWETGNKDAQENKDQTAAAAAAPAAANSNEKPAAAAAQVKPDQKTTTAEANVPKQPGTPKEAPLPSFDLTKMIGTQTQAANDKAKEIADKAKENADKLKAESDKALAEGNKTLADGNKAATDAANTKITGFELKTGPTVASGDGAKPNPVMVTVKEVDTGKKPDAFVLPAMNTNWDNKPAAKPQVRDTVIESPKPSTENPIAASNSATKETLPKDQGKFVLPPPPASANGFDQTQGRDALAIRTSTGNSGNISGFDQPKNSPALEETAKTGQTTRILAGGDDRGLNGQAGQDRSRQTNNGFTQPPANQLAQAGLGNPITATRDSSDARPSFPVGAQPTASTRPITAPTPVSAGSASVESYDQEVYISKPGDSFKRLSQQYYQSDRYEQALQQFNRDHPLAQADFKKNPSTLTPGQALFIPPIRVLEKNYAAAIAPATAPPAAPVPSNPMALSVPISRPELTTQQRYRVRANGEMMRTIAQRTLQNGDRWPEIYALNKQFDPKDPVPAGSDLALPADARIDPSDVSSRR